MSRTNPLCLSLVLTTCLTFALVSLTARNASAYCQTLTCQKSCSTDKKGCPVGGEPLFWQKLPIVYRFHSRGSRILVREEARAAIRAAFHRWSDVVCNGGARTSLRFSEQEDVDADKPLTIGDRAPEPFGIYFRDFGWPHKDGDATLALTTHLFSKTTGKIEYSDMEVNTGAKRFSTDESGDATDLQSVITHEVGHYIGLAHSKADQSIMAERYCDSGDNRCSKGKFAARRLAPDDIEAVCDLYPPGGITTAPSDDNDAKKGDGGLISSCAATSSSSASLSSSPMASIAIVALVGLLAFLGRRLSARRQSS